MAEKALIAANSQHTVLPTQATGSALVVRLEQIRTLDAEIADVDAQITELFRQHDGADVPGCGTDAFGTSLPEGRTLNTETHRTAGTSGKEYAELLAAIGEATPSERAKSTAKCRKPWLSA